MSLSRTQLLRELELLPVWREREKPDGDKIMPILTPEPIGAAHISPVDISQDVPQQSTLPERGYLKDIIQMDWQALQRCVASCQACALSQTRIQTVFGVGDPNAEWLFIGEAPGVEEDHKGEPFVGQAGQLLDNMLTSIGLKRGQNVYIVNVLKCRPPENRDPQGEEVKECSPYLKRQVELIKPKLIVALGKFAAEALLGSDGTISSMRGKQHDYQGIPVVVTYHPAYLLRNMKDKAKAWEDLCFALATMQMAAQPQSKA